MDIPALFSVVNRRYRQVIGWESGASTPYTLEQVVAWITEFFLWAHWKRGQGGEPIFLNATDDPLAPHVPGAGDPGWQQITGWCGGAMTAYPLLAREGAARAAALENLDFLAENGITPCGLKAPIFDGKRWLFATDVYSHIRMPADHLTYLLKAIRYERAVRQCEHAAWAADARRGLEALCRLWRAEGDFGLYLDTAGKEPRLRERGTCAGAFALLALAQGMLTFPEEHGYREVYQQAAEYYYTHFVRQGHCNGGPLDILAADDSESAGALTNAYVAGWQALQQQQLLDMAVDTAHIFATWVLCYRAPFPPASTLHGINPCGGVLANVQNRHIGPGLATNSARFLYDLAQATGDDFFAHLYHDIVTAPLNFVCPADGAFAGFERNSGACLPFYRGMVSEQINLNDALNSPGEMWRVSASWAATSVLLSWMEHPDTHPGFVP